MTQTLFLSRKQYDYLISNNHNLARRLQKEFSARNWSLAGVTYYGISKDLIKKVEIELSKNNFNLLK